MERLTSEQIRLLEELRELRDAGILTVDEFEFQVAKVLGRPLVLESSLVCEELVTPAETDETVVAEGSDEATRENQTVNDDVASASEVSLEPELLEYEFVALETSDEDEILAEENQVVESSSTSDIPAENIAEAQIQQNKSSRRKVFIGTTAGLIVIVVIGLVTLVGGGKSDPTSSQIDDSTTIVTENTSTGSTDAPTSLGNTQAPATSSQPNVITTKAPQNASSGNASRPTTATTPRATDSTLITPSTILNAVSPVPTLTDLRVVKSQPVFYDYPLDIQQTVTFTATILNDAPDLYRCQCGGVVRLIRKDFSGGNSVTGNARWSEFERERPGIWKGTLTLISFPAGRYEYCVLLTNEWGVKCSGPTVSFEVLEQERNPPVVSQLTMTPERVSTGDTVRISVRVTDVTGVDGVRGRLTTADYMLCGEGDGSEFSLISGNSKDGLWSFDCRVTSPPGQGLIVIYASGIYSDPSTIQTSFEVL